MSISIKSDGICYITISKNNIIFSLTNFEGKQYFWFRPAMLHFKGSKQIFNIFAMEQTLFRFIMKLKTLNILRINLIFSGFFKKWIGKGLIKAFKLHKIVLLGFKYRVTRAHGYMRLKKKRRL